MTLSRAMLALTETERRSTGSGPSPIDTRSAKAASCQLSRRQRAGGQFGRTRERFEVVPYSDAERLKPTPGRGSVDSRRDEVRDDRLVIRSPNGFEAADVERPVERPGHQASARPAMTAGIVAATGLYGAVLRNLVHRFYAKVRADAELAPVFVSRIADWEPHLERMVAFWSAVALMTGRYHGRPVPAHVGLQVGWGHFERWLALFQETALETCSSEGAAHIIERAERVARSLHLAVEDAARATPEPSRRRDKA